MTDKLKELLREWRDFFTGPEVKGGPLTSLRNRTAATLDYLDGKCGIPAPDAEEWVEPTVVAFLMKEDGFEPYVTISRYNAAVVEPLMTVAQHRRILAGVNQQAGSGWVACVNEMPHQGQKVLVFAAEVEPATYWAHEEGVHDGDSGFADDYDNEIFPVTHWMPLPPSPAAKAVTDES